MKTLRRLFLGISMLMLIAEPALAVDTSRTYSSGILVGAFLAFCALVVVMQLMPTLIILFGFVKGLVKGTSGETARQNSRS
jgi:hypothetical protein